MVAQRSIKFILPFILLLSLGLIPVSPNHQQISMERKYPITIVVHGGAGWINRESVSEKQANEVREVLNQALQTGYGIMAEGGSSMDAVEATIRILEDSPLFNAGKGAVFTHEETNELDASIMEGKTLNAGAIAGVKRIKNPISAARAVMEESPHVMLSGDGAEIFAGNQGLELVDPSYFKTKKSWDRIQNILKEENERRKEDRGDNGRIISDEFKYGTVGCVALDAEGNLAAGTSTGGMTNKQYGRIGDSPVIGAGTYANNNTCGISCTGHGEYFIRYAVAHDISAMMEYAGLPLEDAAYQVVHEKLKAAGGVGGIIGIDKEGNVAMVFNSEGMYRGYMRQGENAVVKVYGDE